MKATLTLDLIDYDDGTKWCAVIFIGEQQIWCSPRYFSKRDAKAHGEEVLREYQEES